MSKQLEENKPFSLDIPRMGYFILYKSPGKDVFGRTIISTQKKAGIPEEDAQYTHVEVSGGGQWAVKVTPPKIAVTNILETYKGRHVKIVRFKGYDGPDGDKKRCKVAFWAGEIMITDASGNRRLRRNTSDTTVTWANIDTGSEANATYYVYAVADASATTFTVMISTNATTPTGATFYRKIGSFINVAGDISKKSISDDLYVTDGSIKGWAKFSPSDGSIIASYNVTSVSKNSTGSYTITWAIDFADADYCIVISNSTNSTVIPGTVTAQSAGACTIGFGILPNGAAADPSTAVYIAAFGRQ